MDEKRRQYLSEWKKKNRKSVAQRQKKYRDDNYEQVRSYERKYYLANREKVIARAKERYKAGLCKPKSKQAEKEYLSWVTAFNFIDLKFNNDLVA